MNETISDLDAVRVFAVVVASGSFTAAGKRLAMPKSTVSRRVAELETALGIRLLHRTTRKLALTDEGQVYLARAEAALEQLQQAERALSDMRETPRGLLRVTAPVDFARTLLSSLVLDFRARFPEVTVELDLSNRVVDLVGEGFDVALRASTRMQDATLVARRVVASELALFASPNYLVVNPAPQSPAELVGHRLVLFRAKRMQQRLSLRRGDERAELTVTGILSGNDFGFLRQATIDGAGIAALPVIECADDVREGRLVPVLRGYRNGTGAIYAAYPSARFVTPKVRAFVDFVVERLSGLDQEACDAIGAIGS